MGSSMVRPERVVTSLSRVGIPWLSPMTSAFSAMPKPMIHIHEIRRLTKQNASRNAYEAMTSPNPRSSSRLAGMSTKASRIWMASATSTIQIDWIGSRNSWLKLPRVTRTTTRATPPTMAMVITPRHRTTEGPDSLRCSHERRSLRGRGVGRASDDRPTGAAERDVVRRDGGAAGIGRGGEGRRRGAGARPHGRGGEGLLRRRRPRQRRDRGRGIGRARGSGRARRGVPRHVGPGEADDRAGARVCPRGRLRARAGVRLRGRRRRRPVRHAGGRTSACGRT